MDVDEISTITINAEYAKTYEERKRNEELSRLKEKYGDVKIDSDEEDESTSEEEDELGELVTPEVDAQIMKTISAIRSKDPRVYDSHLNFFAVDNTGLREFEISDDEIQKARQDWTDKRQKKKDEGKPVHLKDYHRQMLLEGGGIIDEKNKVDVKSKAAKIGLMTLEESQKLKNEFKAAISEFDLSTKDDDEDFFIQRLKTDDELKAEEEEYKKFLLECIEDNSNDVEFVNRWRNHETDPGVDKDEAFLIDYILNRGWIDKDSAKIPSYEELITEHEDEEQFDEAVDNFESQYNFRFEEEW
ncbi:2699_t:CDS:2, partial [Acaulospora colombiana]